MVSTKRRTIDVKVPADGVLRNWKTFPTPFGNKATGLLYYDSRFIHTNGTQITTDIIVHHVETKAGTLIFTNTSTYWLPSKEEKL